MSFPAFSHAPCGSAASRVRPASRPPWDRQPVYRIQSLHAREAGSSPSQSLTRRSRPTRSHPRPLTPPKSSATIIFP